MSPFERCEEEWRDHRLPALRSQAPLPTVDPLVEAVRVELHAAGWVLAAEPAAAVIAALRRVGPWPTLTQQEVSDAAIGLAPRDPIQNASRAAWLDGFTAGTGWLVGRFVRERNEDRHGAATSGASTDPPGNPHADRAGNECALSEDQCRRQGTDEGARRDRCAHCGSSSFGAPNHGRGCPHGNEPTQ